MISYSQIIVTLFSALNPLVAIPLYLDIARHFRPREKALILSAFGISMFSVMALAFFLGDPLLNAIGIHDYSLRIGGGLIVLLIAISIVTSGTAADKPARLNPKEEDYRKKIICFGVSPLAIPVVIGPGSIILVILYSQQAEDLGTRLTYIGIFLAISLLITLIFAASNLIYRLIGDIGLVVLSKLMGLVLAAVAVEMILTGIRLASPFLSGSGG